MNVPTTKRLLDNLTLMLSKHRRLHLQNLAIIVLNAGMGFINILNLWALDWEWLYWLLLGMNFPTALVIMLLDRRLRKDTRAIRTLRECVESLNNMGDRAYTPEGNHYALFLIEQAEAAYYKLTGEVLFKDGWQKEFEK